MHNYIYLIKVRCVDHSKIIQAEILHYTNLKKKRLKEYKKWLVLFEFLCKTSVLPYCFNDI